MQPKRSSLLQKKPPNRNLNIMSLIFHQAHFCPHPIFHSCQRTGYKIIREADTASSHSYLLTISNLPQQAAPQFLISNF